MKNAKLFSVGIFLTVLIFSCGDNSTDWKKVDSLYLDSLEKAEAQKHADKMNSQGTINLIDPNGLRQGYWKIIGAMIEDSAFAADAIVKEGLYVDGKEEGVWIEHSPDGSMKTQTNYHEGKVIK